MIFNTEYNPEKLSELAKAVIDYAPEAMRGHVDPRIMPSYHCMSAEVATTVKKKGGDLKALLSEKINKRGDQEFKGLCPQGADYFGQALVQAFESVADQCPDTTKVKEFAKQVADMATINGAKATGAFDCVLKS